VFHESQTSTRHRLLSLGLEALEVVGILFLARTCSAGGRTRGTTFTALLPDRCLTRTTIGLGTSRSSGNSHCAGLAPVVDKIDYASFELAILPWIDRIPEHHAISRYPAQDVRSLITDLIYRESPTHRHCSKSFDYRCRVNFAISPPATITTSAQAKTFCLDNTD